MDEPFLCFAGDGLHIDPKSGIARYGPRSYETRRHPELVRVGLIGTAETIEKSREWVESGAQGMSGNAKHPEFPGFQADRGFFSKLEFDDSWVEQLTQSEMDVLEKTRSSANRFENCIDLLENKLRLLAEKDQPPQYVVVGLPDLLLRRCSVADYIDSHLGIVHRDLRRAFKAIAMKYRIPTQILRQHTMEGKDDDHPSKIAWNFFTGLYSKAGGIPWAPRGLIPGTCYVGISFYRPLGSKQSTMQTSLVQAFDDNGEGLVLRGHAFDWDPAKQRSRSPHLTQTQAHELIEMVLKRYQEEMKRFPRRVVVHKTSR